MPREFCAIRMIGIPGKTLLKLSRTSSLLGLLRTCGFTITIAKVTPCSLITAPSNCIDFTPSVSAIRRTALAKVHVLPTDRFDGNDGKTYMKGLSPVNDSLESSLTALSEIVFLGKLLERIFLLLCQLESDPELTETQKAVAADLIVIARKIQERIAERTI